MIHDIQGYVSFSLVKNKLVSSAKFFTEHLSVQFGKSLT